MTDKRARAWFAATAAAVLAGLVIQLSVTAQDTAVFGGSALGRALNVFSYFTILSNLIVGITSLLLALNPARSSTVFRVFRLAGLVAIIVTFVVFHVALSRLLDLDTWAQAANQLLHTAVPVLTVAGWWMFGPRGLTSARIARLTVLYPLGYGIFEMIRGPLSSDFYNYPFVNVKQLGYLRVAINSLWIALLFVGLAAGTTALDRRLAPRQPDPDAADPGQAVPTTPRKTTP